MPFLSHQGIASKLLAGQLLRMRFDSVMISGATATDRFASDFCLSERSPCKNCSSKCLQVSTRKTNKQQIKRKLSIARMRCEQLNFKCVRLFTDRIRIANLQCTVQYMLSLLD